MTRVIAGTAKGRPLRVPERGTRPTSDRVRESLFSSLDHRLGNWHGRCIYDLYAGSGAVAIEALSRGAQRAVLVERDRAAAAIIRQNLQTTGLDATVVQADVGAFVTRPALPVPDVVFVDPPYELPADTVAEQLGTLLAGVVDHEVLLVVERNARDEQSPLPAGCTDVDVRRIGETALTFAHWYRSSNDDGSAHA